MRLRRRSFVVVESPCTVVVVGCCVPLVAVFDSRFEICESSFGANEINNEWKTYMRDDADVCATCAANLIVRRSRVVKTIDFVAPSTTKCAREQPESCSDVMVVVVVVVAVVDVVIGVLLDLPPTGDSNTSAGQHRESVKNELFPFPFLVTWTRTAGGGVMTWHGERARVV